MPRPVAALEPARALQASCTCLSTTADAPGLRRSFEEFTAEMVPDLDGVHVVASCVGQLSVQRAMCSVVTLVVSASITNHARAHRDFVTGVL